MKLPTKVKTVRVIDQADGNYWHVNSESEYHLCTAWEPGHHWRCNKSLGPEVGAHYECTCPAGWPRVVADASPAQDPKLAKEPR